MPYLEHNDAQLYYEVHGSGPPLLLIAGLASDSQSWLSVLSALAGQFTVILLDNRGVGRSTQQCEVSIGRMADDCAALVAHLGSEPVTLLGHSMGGMVAMECAARYPHLVENLVLVATTARASNRNNLLSRDWAAGLEAGTDPAAWFRAIFFWIFTERFFGNQAQLEGALCYQLNYRWPQSLQAFRDQVEAIATFDGTQSLGRIAAPTCVIAGEFDMLMPVRGSADLAREIPGARLEVIEGAAHSIHVERPHAFIAAVVRFLRGNV